MARKKYSNKTAATLFAIMIFLSYIAYYAHASNNSGGSDSSDRTPAYVAATSPSKYRVTSQRTTLDNGLQLIVLENHRAAVITHMLWFYAGSADEPRGKSGVAHYLEHMMFKGAKNQKDGEYSRRIESFGGEYNAFTGRDYTAYYVTASKDRLAEIMLLEAQRMKGLKPEIGTFQKEREVIIEERRMRIENNPAARLKEAMRAALFRNHPYRIPIIGWKHEMLDLTQKDVMRFYKKHYRPNNAVLIIAGDITFEEAKKMAQKYYGDWSYSDDNDNNNKVGNKIEKQQPYTPEARGWLREPLLEVEQTISLRDEKVDKEQWLRYYMVPSIASDDSRRHALALILLDELLAGGNSSLLHQELVVKRKKAVSVGSSYDAFSLDNSIFALSITPTDGVSLDEIEKIYHDTLEEIIKNGFDDELLQSTKNRLKAETIYARDGISSMAFIFGNLVMIGLGDEFFNGWADYIEGVTKEEIIASAKKFLLEAPSVSGRLLPLDDKHKGSDNKSSIQ